MPSPLAPDVQLIAIAAMASNRVIGRNGTLPWHLPEDLKFFKKTTAGHPVLMGRKTFESIVAALGKPLPNRRNIVLSSTLAPQEGIEVIPDLASLSQLSALTSPVYLIGGAQLYSALLPVCDELLLTWIDQAYEGDAFFPAFEGDFTLQEVLGRGEGFEFRRYVRSGR
ncbi:dihydrofolate reductase [Verrucomicrobium sp. BvORR034]|uniref:dihydrofolate reductase n=1 Tax=Verrucomicrobium sp. BvORR034 TaxID=1396418 RepID=UPI000679C7E8|nr:dihydrofolate reductase [Verrucomicrobium sp. BvORR034]